MHVAPTALQLGSGSGDPILVLGSDGHRVFQGLAHGMGMEGIDLEMMFELKLVVGDLELSRWELTDRPGGDCHRCGSLWMQGRSYSIHGLYRLFLASFGHFGYVHR